MNEPDQDTQRPIHIPPLRKDCACECSEVDEYGRAKIIGWCGPDCERRPQ